jgi:hypothetical protein
MIIFDLDGTLADCEHRRHFVDPSKNSEYHESYAPDGFTRWLHKKTSYKFKPDWKAFYEACDKDEPIIPVMEILQNYINLYYSSDSELFPDIQIWSGRCSSVRGKTQIWLKKYGFDQITLKMRPMGDSTPDDQLKERWLDEAIEEGNKIEFVFDSDPKSIAMWRSKGIFVFNCCQHAKEF